MKIFSSVTSQPLTDQICQVLNDKISNENFYPGKLKIDKFSDGELLPLFQESIRDEDVFYVNTPNSSESIIETLLVMDAAKRSGCKSFTLVAPYLPYSRQDKTDHLRSSIGSKVLADIFEKAGMTRIITIDLHASAIQGFYNVPVIHLNGNKIFIDHIDSLDLDEICIVAPDQGAVKRAADFCKAFPDATFAMINKKRIKPNEVHSMELVGEVNGKNVIMVDDLTDTGGTLAKATEILIQNGAKSVRSIATHGVLSGKAQQILNDSKLVSVIVSDTIPTTLEKGEKIQKLEVISASKLIANSILAIHTHKSINVINTI